MRALGRWTKSDSMLRASCLGYLQGRASSSRPWPFDPPGAVDGRVGVECPAGRPHSHRGPAGRAIMHVGCRMRWWSPAGVSRKLLESEDRGICGDCVGELTWQGDPTDEHAQEFDGNSSCGPVAVIVYALGIGFVSVLAMPSGAVMQTPESSATSAQALPDNMMLGTVWHRRVLY